MQKLKPGQKVVLMKLETLLKKGLIHRSTKEVIPKFNELSKMPYFFIVIIDSSDRKNYNVLREFIWEQEIEHWTEPIEIEKVLLNGVFSAKLSTKNYRSLLLSSFILKTIKDE